MVEDKPKTDDAVVTPDLAAETEAVNHSTGDHKVDAGWNAIPPVNTPHVTIADPEFTAKPGDEPKVAPLGEHPETPALKQP